jgi:hypothetical protein
MGPVPHTLPKSSPTPCHPNDYGLQDFKRIVEVQRQARLTEVFQSIKVALQGVRRLTISATYEETAASLAAQPLRRETFTSNKDQSEPRTCAMAKHRSAHTLAFSGKLRNT